MPYFCQLAGHETAKIVADGAQNWRAVASTLRTVYTTLYQMTVELAGGDPADDDVSYTVLQGTFTSGGRIPLPFDRTAFEDFLMPELPSNTPQERKHLAQFIGVVLGNIALSVQQGATSPRQGGDASRTPRASGGRGNAPDRFSDVLASTRNSIPENRRRDFDGVVERMRELENDESLNEQPPRPEQAAVGGAGRDYGPLRAVLEMIIRIFAEAIERACPQNHQLDRIVDDALLGLEQRFALAAEIAYIGRVHRWDDVFRRMSSSRSIGNHVHNVIQGEFEFHRVPISDIVAERWDPNARRPSYVRRGRGWAMISVRGPSTRGSTDNLVNLVAGRHDQNRFFTCVQVGLSYYTPLESEDDRTLRADVIDRQRRHIWEIKPMRGAVGGVLQETKYRLLINLTAELYRCLGLNSPPLLQSGDSLTFPLPTFNITDQSGTPSIVVPFTILPALKGLIIYAVFRAVADGVTLTVLLTQLNRLFRMRLRDLRNQQPPATGGGAVPVPVTAYEIDWEAVFISVVILIILILLLVALVALITTVLAFSAVGDALAAAGALLLLLTGLAPLLAFNGPSATITMVAEREMPPPEDPVNIDIGFVQVRDIPRSAALALLDFLGAAYPTAKEVQDRHLEQALRAARRGLST